MLKNLWPKLRTVVTIDWRMTSTALWSDYVLPAAAWYERTEHKWVTPLMPFIHAGEKATSFYEAKSDWEIFSRLAAAVDAAAAARGIEEFTDRHGRERPFEGLYDTFSSGGEYGHTDDDKVARALIESSTNLEGVDWEELKKRGWARFTDVGNEHRLDRDRHRRSSPTTRSRPSPTTCSTRSPTPRSRGASSSTSTRSSTSRWASSSRLTRTRRRQGGDYPLILSGGHTRWSIHSAWRDDRLMLQLQRGEPTMWMSAEDAEAREDRRRRPGQGLQRSRRLRDHGEGGAGRASR